MLDLALLLTQLLVILAAARAAGRIGRAIGQPRVIGEMAAGIALGPSVFGLLSPEAMRALFPESGMLPLSVLSQLGVILFMFVIGLRLDLAVLRGRVRSSVAIGHASIAVPFVLGVILGSWLYPSLAGDGAARLPFKLFLGAAMSVTAFPVLARILAERGLMHTRIGAVTIASAAVGDVTAWCLLAGVVGVARGGDALWPFVGTMLGAVAYAVCVLTIGRRVLQRWDERRVSKDPSGLSVHDFGLVVGVALGSALATELVGVHPLFGAFLAGTIVPRDLGLARAVGDRLEDILTTLLLPVFFALTGLRTELGLVAAAGLWGVFAVILAIAVVGKLGGSAIAARLAGTPWREACAIGVLMNTRGLMELVILNVGLEIGVIAPALFAMMVIMALTTTVITSPLLVALLGSRSGGAQPAHVAASTGRQVAGSARPHVHRGSRP
ncbi:MAG: cation:proton antiporter [Vicinamibacterales bacterium]